MADKIQPLARKRPFHWISKKSRLVTADGEKQAIF